MRYFNSILRSCFASCAFFLLLAGTVSAQPYAYCECTTGKAKCLGPGEGSRTCISYCAGAVNSGNPANFVKEFHGRDGRCYQPSPEAPAPCSRPPAPGDLPPNIKAALDAGTPVLATLFYADDVYPPGNGQCEGAAHGRLYAPLGEWTPEIRIDADGKSGGCCQAWAILDPKHKLGDDFSMSVNWVYDGGIAEQCGNGGPRQIPVWRDDPPPAMENAIAWSTFIRIDTDDRAGGCYEDFQIAGGKAGTQLEVEFGPDGDGQCEGGPSKTAVSGGDAIRFRIDTDNRGGGCRQRFRLILP